MADGKTVKQRGPGRPFKKGAEWNGNANGRPPKTKCVSSLLAEILKGNPQKATAKWKQDPTGAMIVAIALFGKMSKGDLTAIKEGLDRVEGRVPQPLQHSGENGQPIKQEINFTIGDRYNSPSQD